GAAHILEHVVLAGSQRFPVRDPFFSMTRRSLATFMNALTGLDWTMYLFSTRNAKDFTNLLEVYLDAAFFPLLSEDAFQQEGIRYEFENPADPNSGLRYKGVVWVLELEADSLLRSEEHTSELQSRENLV